MEDTHLAMLNFNGNPDLDLFAVFDGHGGMIVSLFRLLSGYTRQVGVS